MNAVATIAAALLGGVLAVAGGAKLRRRPATAGAFASMGLPFPGALATAVPAAELALAALLVVRPRAGGTAALVTLAVFSAVLARAATSGAGVSCGCFGAAHDRPVAARDLVRNGLLAIAATMALAAPTPVRPTLEALVLVTSATVTGLVVLALVDLRSLVGAVWDNRSAGEAAR